VGRRRRAYLALGAAALLAVGYSARVALWRPPPLAGELPDDGWTRVSGVAHIHTTFSDGGGTPEEVIAEATEAGLDFIIITDHDNLDAKGAEGYHDGLLVLVACEISTEQGHIVGYGIPDPAYRFSGEADEAMLDVRDLGGFSVAAHPASPHSELDFTAWELPGPWGMELVNGDSQWREAGWLRLARTLLYYGLNSRLALLGSLGSPTANLEHWDRLLRERDVAGFFGADAHSRIPISRKRGIRFPGYRALFEVVSSYVLLEAPLSGDFEDDGRAILEALRRGRSYIGVDALGDASGFFFRGEGGGGVATMGETIAPAPDLTLSAGGRLPEGTRLRLLRDGVPFAEAEAALRAEAPGPGVYRVEAWRPGWGVPWVLSNPIYVFDDNAAARRRARAAWPPAPVPPEPAEVLDAFEGPPSFGAEFDDSSWMEREVLVENAGADGGKAARLAFRLGAPGPGRPHTWCALVNREERDLSGRSGLVFSIKADGVYRLWVQVRDRNPDSLDEGTEWWFASVRTSEQWARVQVPFARLRTLNPRSDGRLDPDEVVALVFVLDRGAVKPGTSGTIWIDDLGVY
jgi:hypothetical protein